MLRVLRTQAVTCQRHDCIEDLRRDANERPVSARDLSEFCKLRVAGLGRVIILIVPVFETSACKYCKDLKPYKCKKRRI